MSPATYQSYEQLQRFEHEGRDYRITSRLTSSPVAVMAPHGGRIEPGTAAIAAAIAGKEYSYYGFSGMKAANNGVLHLTSTRFDEPVALSIAHRAMVVLTIHGCRGDSSLIQIGGRDHRLAGVIAEGCRQHDIASRYVEHGNLCGMHPANLCNRGSSGRGVQLELTRALRESLFVDLRAEPGLCTTERFDVLVATVRDALRIFFH